MPAGYTPRDEEILGAVACEFAQKCVLDFIGRLKPEFARLQPASSSNVSVVNEEVKHKNMVSFNDTYRLNLARQLRRSVIVSYF